MSQLPENLPVVNKEKIAELIDNKNSTIGCEYQAIVDIKTNSVIGYEALSRFYIDGISISPHLIFETAHEDRELFFRLESTVKKMQVENSVKGKKLFLNLDPHYFEKDNHLQFWLDFLINQNKHNNFCIEITENLLDVDMKSVKHFADWLSELNITFGLDDIGGEQGFLPMQLLSSVNFIKIDKRWLELIRADESYTVLLQDLVMFVQKHGGFAVFEGLETEADLKIAKKIKIDYGQGYYFRQHQINIEPEFNKKKIVTKENFISTLGDYDKEVLGELVELEDEMNSTIIQYGNNPEELPMDVIGFCLRMYSKKMFNFIEFEKLSTTISDFSNIVDRIIKQEDLDCYKTTYRMVCGIVEDLINWRVSVFEASSKSCDIHFLDDSFTSSYIQLENIVNPNKPEILTDDTEFFDIKKDGYYLSLN